MSSTRLTALKTQGKRLKSVSYTHLTVGSDVDDIYEELDIYFKEKYVENDVLAEAIDTEKLVEQLYESEGRCV